MPRVNPLAPPQIPLSYPDDGQRNSHKSDHTSMSRAKCAHRDQCLGGPSTFPIAEPSAGTDRLILQVRVPVFAGDRHLTGTSPPGFSHCGWPKTTTA